tara:strand:+ start:8940 stop:9173 length:234 start_codon:yes stop_codon:yes gene_type:complete
MAAEETLQTLAALTVIGGVLFVILMIFNINSLVKYFGREKTEGATDVKQHSTFFWLVDGFFTFLFSLDFLTIFLIFI